MAVVIVTDWRWQRIPNQATYPAMLVGLALGILEGVPGSVFRGGALDHAAGLGLAFLVSYPLLAVRALKAGDVKMLMAIGALKGPIFLLTAALYGSLVSLLVALAAFGFGRLEPMRAEEPSPFGFVTDRLPGRIRSALRQWFPYGVGLGIGALIALGLAP